MNDERPRITFHINDMPHEKQCLSHYTGRDIILKLVSTLHAKKCANVVSSLSPPILTVWKVI